MVKVLAPGRCLRDHQATGQLASHTGKKTGEQTMYLFQRLEILLMRGNSALILIRTPTYVEAEDDGDQDYMIICRADKPKISFN